MGTEGKYLNVIKAIYDKPSANIGLNGETLKSFPLRSGTRRGGPLPPLLLNLALEVLARAIRQVKEIKGIQIGKEGVRVPLFADDMILCIENPKDSTKKPCKYSKVAGCKVEVQNPLLFHVQYQHQDLKEGLAPRVRWTHSNWCVETILYSPVMNKGNVA